MPRSTLARVGRVDWVTASGWAGRLLRRRHDWPSRWRASEHAARARWFARSKSLASNRAIASSCSRLHRRVGWARADVQPAHDPPDLRPDIVCRRSAPSRSFVLATLRALHLDRFYVGDMMHRHEGPRMLALSVVRVIVEQIALPRDPTDSAAPSRTTTLRAMRV